MRPYPPAPTFSMRRHVQPVPPDLGWPMVRERMASLCENVHGVLEDHDLERTSVDPPMAGQVASLVAQRSKRMLSYLAKLR